MNTPGARISNDIAHRKTPRRALSDSRKIYRQKWIEVLKENPQANRNKLIKLANFEYLWLMRNDSKWMKMYLPDVLKIPRKREILDWHKIDSDLSKKVEIACQEIYSNIPIKRVCITEILRKIGYKKWLEKRELKLPKTTQILNRQLESLEDYMIRKLRLAEREFIDEKAMPTKNQLIRRAIIENNTTKNSERIQNEITKSLKGIENSI